MGVTRRSCLFGKGRQPRELLWKSGKKDAVEALNGLFQDHQRCGRGFIIPASPCPDAETAHADELAGASVKVSKNRLAKLLLKARTLWPSAPC